jgi:transposase
MPKAYSGDLRERVVAAVEAGEPRRAAARRFEVSVSSAIKWAARWRATGSAAAKPAGGSRSPLEDHAELLLGLRAEQPDRTLVELRDLLAERGVASSRTAVWRFFKRRRISFKKNRAGQRAGAAGRARRAPGLGGGAARA